MSDYANDAIERDLSYLDIENPDDVDGFTVKSHLERYEFIEVKSETDKAWLFVMVGGNELWLPKSKCSIEGNIVQIPSWLAERIVNTQNK